ncbi:hypothetical protein GCM10010182_23020 [Actinomadura cremea]|nr:hypothetical protein GCM10010182_23020 [Actinomadura cremea]
MTTPPHSDRTSGEPPQEHEPGEAATVWASPDTGAAPAPPVPAPPAGIPLGPPPPSFAPPAPDGPLPRSRLAVTTLVTGLLGLVPVAIAFGIAALVVLRRRTRKGKGLAYGGLAASLAWIAAAVAVVVVMAVSTFSVGRDASGRITDGGKVQLSTLREGDCYTGFGPDDVEITLVDAVPCAEPHRGEVIARVPTGTGLLDGTEVCPDRTAFLDTSRHYDDLEPYIHSPAYPGDDEAVICAMHYVGAEPLTTKLADTLDDSLKKPGHLRTGECVENLGGERGESWTVERVRTVPCTEPHRFQVYATFDVPYQDGDPEVRPGQEYIFEATEKGCDDRFWDAIDERTGTDYEITYVTPNPLAWHSDRKATCFVGLPGGVVLEESIVSE